MTGEDLQKTNDLERRGKVVLVAVELVMQMMRTGWTLSDRVRCVDGLPENAELRQVDLKRHTQQVEMLFVCPDWPVVADGAAWPMLTPVYRREKVE